MAYKDTHFFTGIVQCKNCKFLTRYHGQITGTSHMRRHHCFSLLFPNSVPATRKSKSNTNTPNTLTNGNGLNNVEADTTTPRMLKKLKKELSPSRGPANKATGSGQPAFPVIKQEMDFNSFMTQAAMSAALNGAASSALSASNHSNLTIHPQIPKKRLKNGHYGMQAERSLMVNGNCAYGSPNNGNSMSTSQSSPTVNSSQSMLRASTGSSPSSSPIHGGASNQSSGSLAVPTTVTNNLRIQNSKQDLRERLVQFCCQELVPIGSVNSEAFRAILQSHLRLCTTQLHQQLAQQQQQHPQLMSITSMVSSFMNHISHQMPDGDQLTSHLKVLHGQCRDKIRHDLSRTLDANVGGALVCDSEADACIISAYYIDTDWRLVEAILAVSAEVSDINQFVSTALVTYSLQDSKKLSKFTFVSHGGLFDGVSVCLSSMAHIVDKVVEEAITSADELFQSKSKKLPLLSDLLDSCADLATRYNLPALAAALDGASTVLPSNGVEWIAKFESAKLVLQHRDQLLQEEEAVSLNYELIGQLMDLLEPFRTASAELRQCFKHPTLSHVLLYFYKLKKVLATNSSYASLLRLQTEPTNLSKKSHPTKVNGGTPPMPPKKAKRGRSLETSDQSAAGSGSDSDSEEEKEVTGASGSKSEDPLELTSKNGGGKKKPNKRKKSQTDEEEAEDEDFDVASHSIWLLDQFKKFLLENLNRYYEVQSLHRIATFLWPNFRFLKMLSSGEQKEVHEEVRKMLQSRISVAKTDANGNGHGNLSNGACGGGGGGGGGSSSTSSNDGFGCSNGGKLNGTSKTKSTDFDEWEVLSDHDQDEVDKYLSVQLTSCSEDTVLQWWREHSVEFPKLSQLAKWILAIPASVTTRERFQICNNRQLDESQLFLHCNMYVLGKVLGSLQF